MGLCIEPSDRANTCQVIWQFDIGLALTLPLYVCVYYSHAIELEIKGERETRGMREEGRKEGMRVGGRRKDMRKREGGREGRKEERKKERKE